MTDLKQVLVDALRASATRFAEVNTYELEGVTTLEIADTHAEFYFDADRLATAVRDHFSTLLANVQGEAIRHAFMEAMLSDKLVTVDDRGRMFQGERELKTDQMVHVFTDRLIEGLAA